MGENETIVQCYVDADWAADSSDRSNRTGVLCTVNGNAVWWRSRKQKSITVSTCEAEYMALFEVAKDVLRNAVCELGFCPGAQKTVSHDNQISISWTENPGLRKVKHIEL